MFNDNVLINFSVQAAVVIPIITAIVQAFKFWINDKYAPFISMLVGIGVTFLFSHDGLNDLSGTILLGLLFGLAASGLYSGLQHTTMIIKQQKMDKLQQQDKRQQQNQQPQMNQQQPQQNQQQQEIIYQTNEKIITNSTSTKNK